MNLTHYYPFLCGRAVILIFLLVAFRVVVASDGEDYFYFHLCVVWVTAREGRLGLLFSYLFLASG